MRTGHREEVPSPDLSRNSCGLAANTLNRSRRLSLVWWPGAMRCRRSMILHRPKEVEIIPECGIDLTQLDLSCSAVLLSFPFLGQFS